uniref:signal-regulatory protein beta-2-like n=1 Tax=Epinephelus lanceolatus TaxID=310571 RepID=UPI0014472899|nr:signal-regulatory protein beta-2-like [Epinephelus lanceolatus]
MAFLNKTLLRVRGPEPDISAVTQDLPSDPVRPVDSVTLQCSVLSDSDNKTCPGDHSVFWFKAGSHESHPRVFYAHGNSVECEKSPEAHSPQKCVYSFSKNVSSSDAGTYYCAVATCGEIFFGNGTKLNIEGPEPDISAVTQDLPSDPVHPGDSVTLQCSVLSDSYNKSCPGDHSVFWFKAGSHESHPNVFYTHGNSVECEKSPDGGSPQKCVYSFSKNISSSDAGTYYCAVATCGEILFGNGTKLDIQAAPVLQTNAATTTDDQQSQQTDEDSLVYSVANFTRVNPSGRSKQKDATAVEEESIYTDVRVLKKEQRHVH